MVSPRGAVEGSTGNVVLVLQVGAGVEQKFDNLEKMATAIKNVPRDAAIMTMLCSARLSNRTRLRA